MGWKYQLIGFVGKNWRNIPYFMGTSRVSGQDFPFVNPLIQRLWHLPYFYDLLCNVSHFCETSQTSNMPYYYATFSTSVKCSILLCNMPYYYATFSTSMIFSILLCNMPYFYENINITQAVNDVSSKNKDVLQKSSDHLWLTSTFLQINIISHVH